MRNKAILFSLILVASNAVLAEQSSLETAAKGKATEVTPNAVEKVEATNQTLDKAKTLKEGAEIAPDALQDQPKEAEKSVETLKTGKETTENLKGKVGDVPKSTKAIKSKAKGKAAEKALELPH